jgi:NAD-dependent dihydropyrimidine dehydrogenase PreA subunit
MTYVIGEPCVDVLDRACVEECPVDCIYEGERMLYIHPDECVDGRACEPVCPVEAIYYEDDPPDQWRVYAGENPGSSPSRCPGAIRRSARRAALPRPEWRVPTPRIRPRCRQGIPGATRVSDDVAPTALPMAPAAPTGARHRSFISTTFRDIK